MRLNWPSGLSSTSSTCRRILRVLTHLGVEDALGSAVVGSEWGSGGGLWVAKFFEGRTHGAGVFAA
jgi:hypothetical protein